MAALVVAFADAPGLAFPDGLGLALPDGLGLGEVGGAGAADDGASSSTRRNLSWAVVETSLITCWEPCPGTVTLIRSLPICCTWAPVLPEPLTRASMIATACFMSVLDGAFFPFGGIACSVACVPLVRSSPRPTRKS